VKVLAISGSLRRDSHNTALLRAAAEHAPAGVELELWDGLKAVPPYDEDDDLPSRERGGASDGHSRLGAGGEQAPAAVAALRSAIAGADAVLFATPEYNHSVPGALKNALDWVSRPHATNPLRNKPVAVVGASTGSFGAVWAQAELRKVLGAIGARVLDRELAVGQAAERVAGGPVDDAEILAELRDLTAELADAVRAREEAIAGRDAAAPFATAAGRAAA
jgi:chromate reductase, NAD(P)H dehydrogenase (quinone)